MLAAKYIQKTTSISSQYLPSEVATIFYPKPVKRSSLVGECAERIVDIWQSDLECVCETEAS